VLEGNQAKLMAKVAKYKEQLEALQDTIKEHQTVQAQLQEKIKAEAKANSGK
jgi:gas vesicle protein